MYYNFSLQAFFFLLKYAIRVAQLNEGTTYSLLRSINIWIKMLKKVGQSKYLG